MVVGRVDPRSQVVCHYLLEKMPRSRTDQPFFCLRPGKWDRPYLRVAYSNSSSDSPKRLSWPKREFCS